MYQVKLFVIYLLVILVSCSDNSEDAAIKNNYNFTQIKAVLKGETLGKKHHKKNNKHILLNYSCDVNYVGNKKSSNEVNLIFKPTQVDSCYNSLNSFYNTLFSSSNTQNKFNSWSNDSLEVLLFKQTDSTILVNIFIKTYK